MMELDELLEDLQSALPPEAEAKSPLPPGALPSSKRSSALSGSVPTSGSGPTSPVVNGRNSPPYEKIDEDNPHLYDSADQEEGGVGAYEMPRSSAERSVSPQLEEDNVQYSEVRKGPRYVPKARSTSRSPPPSTSTTSPPPSKPPRNSGGVAELDSLLEMLNDTQMNIQEKPVPPSQRVGGRPSVADFVDELTEVEDQVRREPGDRHGSRERGLTASTATRELDELMANLSKFEPASGKGDYSQAHREGQKTKSAMDNLNSMLGSLDEDMTKRHGVNTAPKGVCAACNKPILTKVINALGCQWHKEHFTCAQCDIELGSTTYYESNGRPYCEKDYHELFAPRCAYCNGPVLERVLRALDKTWHKEHFFCTLCGKDFGPEGFHEKDGKAFCRECYYEKFAPRCKRCEKAIMEGFITALSSQWHPECFSCKVCGVTFPRGNYFEHEGEPHCEIHYHASRGTLCASCQKPVTGKCITAMGKKWHPEHFTCAFCLKLLNKGTFKEHRHNPYCQPCYIKLFG